MTSTLVLGGARSGKSAYAQRMAETAALAAGCTPVFIATGEAHDAEMTERIATHMAERGGRWRTVEAPLDLAGALQSLKPQDVAVVDCLTLWLSNSMLAETGHAERMHALPAAVAACRGHLWLVSNEVGWGVVPDNALARRYRDEAGRLHQRIAEIADAAVLVVAGLALALKPAPDPSTIQA
ncbi:MAG: bifunctional adenosylcobinamide kinase/adenosylcobinamide-phosphate guanylyltransferase [Caulobacteraceae bacterium]